MARTVEYRADGARIIHKETSWPLWPWLVAVLAVVIGSTAVVLWKKAPPSTLEAKLRSTASIDRPLGAGVSGRGGQEKLPEASEQRRADASRSSPQAAARGVGVDNAGQPAARPAAGAPGESAVAQSAGSEDPPSGIALFPPPGTNPPKSGLIVPDDFDLPPGYVRHYQVTDDGKPLPPILMFHPDAELFDSAGNRLPLPEDLVVPPELAPPGFPIHMLEVPDTGVPLFEAPPDGDAESAGKTD